MNSITTWRNRSQLFVRLGCALLAIIFMSVVSSRTHAESYKFISKEFLSAVSQITPDYYFAEDRPFSEKWKNNLFYEKDFGKRPFLIDEVSTQLCKDISDSYQRMLAKPIEGQENIFQFDHELNTVMRNAGAYVRPLWLLDGEIKESFAKLTWDEKNLPKEEKIREFVRGYSLAAKGGDFRPVALDVNSEGVIKTSAHADSLRFIKGNNYAHEYITGKGLKAESYSLTMSMMHTYLFVLKEDPTDIQKEVIYLYVDIPFEIISQERLTITTLKKSANDSVRCREISRSKMQMVAESGARSSNDPQMNERKKKFFYSAVEDMEPITFPLSPQHNYPIGKNSRYKEGYEVGAENIAEPSIECFMRAMELIDGEPDDCLNTGYAEEYLDALNSNICVSADETKSLADLSGARVYPYKLRYVGQQSPPHLRYMPQNNFCKP